MTEKYNTLSILAIIFTFVFYPAGLILGIIALSQIKKTCYEQILEIYNQERNRKRDATTRYDAKRIFIRRRKEDSQEPKNKTERNHRYLAGGH